MDVLNQPVCIITWTLKREKLLSHVGCANNQVTITALVRIGIKFSERCGVTQFLYVDIFFVHYLNNCIHDYDTSISMFFVNNYSVFVLSVTDMAFSGLHDIDPSDPSFLVLQNRHRSHLVDMEQVCILLNINYYYISLV